MKIVYKNSPPSHLMRASSTENYELITDNFINFSNSTYCVIFVQSLLFFKEIVPAGKPIEVQHLRERGLTITAILIYPKNFLSVSLICIVSDSTAPHRFAEPPELRGACLLTDFLICSRYVLSVPHMCRLR